MIAFLEDTPKGRVYFTDCPHAKKWLTQMGMIVIFEPNIK